MRFKHQAVFLFAVAFAWTTSAIAQPSAVSSAMFEVVVIRPATPDDKNWRMEFNPGLMRIENRSPLDMIKFAYDLGTDTQVLNAPGWASSQHFDIQGKEDEELGKKLETVPLAERRQLMRQLVRSVLEERFKLHAEPKTTEVSVLALVVAKGGAKVVRANSADGRTFRGLVGPAGKIDARGAAMDLLADRLSRAPEAGGRLVLDKTGLAGEYDWSLRWTPETLAAESVQGGGGESAPSLMTALQEQLGLRLESQKAMVPAISVLHLERASAN